MNESTARIASAYAEHERTEGARRLRVGCYLVMILMPLGTLVDQAFYADVEGVPNRLLGIRIVSALLILPILYLFYRPFGVRHYHSLSLAVALIPGGAMCLIIRASPDGAASPYYAAINLILLAIAFIAQWNWRQCLVATLLLLGMYVMAVWADAGNHTGTLINNLWFMLLTGVIVLVGSHLQGRLRFRDFQSNYELNEYRRELETSYRRLQELDELKGRFFANISHELRTPLTLLLSPLERLILERTPSDPSSQELLETMRDNGMRLLKLINNLLDLVRLDAGHLKLSPRAVDVNTFLIGTVNAVRGLARDRGIRLECEVHPTLLTLNADPDKLEKILLNLLFNAIKFTAAGGLVQVTARREDDTAVFSVQDTGMGIAPENLPHLFSRFWQADVSAQRRFQGAGIGLALVKELVVAHGGSVSAESTLGKGTTIHFRLPVGTPAETLPAVAATEPPPESEGDPKEAASANWLNDLYRRAELFAGVASLRETVRPPANLARSQRPKILVVDDEPDMLRFLRVQLQTDYQVIEAMDGDQAVTLAAQYLPEVIVCDLMMPEKDGFTVCRELRDRTSTRALPILIVTADAADQTKLAVLQAGANDILTKPFSLAELRARVRSLCDGSQLQRALSVQNQKLEATLEQLQETELQLVQAEKLASLGRMSAGIIHEINNPLNFALTAINCLSMLAASLPQEERADFEETRRDIEEGLRRVARIIGDLREFTHPGGGEAAETNVRNVADTALRFLAAEWKGKVQIENEIPGSFTVVAASGRLLQVFVNLLQNSLDALRSRTNGETPPTIRLTAADQDDARIIAVRDNGPGIARQDLSKVFDPFFTTKEVGQGTGLGLSICYRLLQEAGASIRVASEQGRFCEFSLVFPRRPLPALEQSNPDTFSM